ncbi:hypothetical protein MMA231_00956 [Asticcacaulis sp. MM231]|uniref:hypothetical protein n=1 Tax=Asticcacaulis sp. MM231 TaxID=3157666 RepID=UPI0032D5B147
MKFETGLTLSAVALIIAACGWAAVTSGENAKLTKQAARQDGCTAYLVTGLTTGRAGSQQDCDPALVDLTNRARAAQRCDQVLVLDGYSSDCSPAVQGLFAQKADLQSQLETTVKDQAAAIIRAEKRATESALRKSKDAEALTLAPRRADGLVTCDAVCLRARFED